MSEEKKNWREEELSLREVIQKYPTVSPFVIIKIDVQRRGFILTPAANEKLDPDKYLTKQRSIFYEANGLTPAGLLFRDGTSVVGGSMENGGNVHNERDPYVIDYADGKFVLTDLGEIIEEVDFWFKPDYYDKVTSKGTPMWRVAVSRPQRVDFNPNHHCHFWDKPGNGCKYCTIGALSKSDEKANIPTRLDMEDVYETAKEILKERGHATNYCLSAGSILSGKELFDDEVDMYIEILKVIGSLYKVEKFPSQIVGSAFNLKQLERLYNETGLLSYTTDLEVLDPKLYEWICPGKTEFVGYEEWKKRLIDAVSIFGKGYVNTSTVAGVALAKPYGHKSEEESLKITLAEVEYISKHGVTVIGSVWRTAPGTIFFKQKTPSLDYYVQLFKGYDDIRRAYGLDVYFDDYRRCGNHPSTDLSRI